MAKKKLSKTFVVLIVLFITFNLQIISENTLLSDNAEDNTNNNLLLPQVKNENLNLKLEFIGFNQALIDEAEIESQLYNHFKHSTSIPQADLYFNFEFNYAEESIRQALEDYINSTAVNGTDTGYEINVTLLYEDLSSGERSDIFIPRD
ncbi:MAG: hypothetical protein KAR08_08925, partial [Candidatus Heimdallarchaeota archaeon]|nr:hypothetical protein [Candidatus Heimdallarchaeota archaeon]